MRLSLLGHEPDIHFARPHMQCGPRRQDGSTDHAIGSTDNAHLAVSAFVRMMATLRNQRSAIAFGQQRA